MLVVSTISATIAAACCGLTTVTGVNVTAQLTKGSSKTTPPPANCPNPLLYRNLHPTSLLSMDPRKSTTPWDPLPIPRSLPQGTGHVKPLARHRLGKRLGPQGRVIYLEHRNWRPVPPVPSRQPCVAVEQSQGRRPDTTSAGAVRLRWHAATVTKARAEHPP